MLRFGQSCHSGAHCRERGRPETSVEPRGEIYRRQQGGGGGAAVKSRMDLGSISFPGRPGLSLFQERAWGGEGGGGDDELAVLILINYPIFTFNMFHPAHEKFKPAQASLMSCCPIHLLPSRKWV